MRKLLFSRANWIIAALTREHDGWEQACLRTSSARSRVKCLVLARPARRNKVLDEVSAENVLAKLPQIYGAQYFQIYKYLNAAHKTQIEAQPLRST